MNPDIEDQVSRYIGFLDEVAPQITLDEITNERMEPGEAQPLRASPRSESVPRWVYAIAAAIGALTLFGGGFWLLGVHALPERVLGPDGTDITAEMEVINNYIGQMFSLQDSPEPLFDTSTLGVEVGLRGPLDTPEKEEVTSFWGFDLDQIDLMWVVPVRTEDTPHVGATYWIETLTVDEAVTLQVGIDIWDRTGRSHGIPPAQLPLDSTFPVVVDYHSDPAGGVIAIGGLPADASVVAMTLDDGTAFWQRPVAGVVIFGPTPSMEGNTEPIDATVLDATGVEMLHIEFNRTGWYRVEEAPQSSRGLDQL